MFRLDLFPRGTAEGLVVLRLDGECDDATAGKLSRAIARSPGAWAFWADSIDWDAKHVGELIEACGETPIAAVFEIGAMTSWPSAEVNWVADASKIVRQCAGDHELAIRLGECSMLPPVRDLVVELDADQTPPSPGSLAMLEAAIRPSCCYLYIPRDYPYRALLLANLGSASSTWAVRWR